MFKKWNGIMLIVLLCLVMPSQAGASGQLNHYYPPDGSDYFLKKLSYQFWIDSKTYKIRFTQFSNTVPKTVISVKTFNVKPNSSSAWFDITCGWDTGVEFLDLDDKVLGFFNHYTENRLTQGTCPGNVTPSDYNEDDNRYASDTFKGSKNKLNNPSTPDGSGGKGTSPIYGEDNGGNHPDDPSNGGTDPGEDPGGGDPGGGDDGDECGDCSILKCPGWGEYMEKIDDIAGKIPPAPNWPVVADTFRDSIVPKLINDLGNLLGTAPSAPSTPPALPPNNNGGINDKRPSMPDLPNIPDFDAGDIKNQAPTIPERSDPTGGFDLLDNPMDTLPDAPVNPKPGQTDPGEWGQNKPAEQDNPFPYPQDQGDPDLGTPPKPGDNGATPPTPGGDPGSAPIPGGDYGTPPSTGGETPPMKDYKPSPDAADGSGGDIWP